ncbi:MAG: hypothetical protein OXB95_07485 [Rhodobacteraceae bacterium]|nr:hypothetical protein [Paracoccaceae bacterium]
MRLMMAIAAVLLFVSSCGLRTDPEGWEITEEFAADDYLHTEM